MKYYFSDNPNGFVTGKRFSIDKPCSTVMAAGLAGDSLGHWHFKDDGMPDVIPPTEDKPPYRVPLLSEIRAIPWNGLTVVSTFAGAGGSSTGYRLAGYRVLLANEFVPVAQESYAANKADYTIVDPRDIKLLKGAEILRRVGLKPGELDVFDGSPPCQAFSTAGQREKGWGKGKRYEHGAVQNNEDLFFEYCRLRDELMPRTFVAENVSGLVKGAAKGYFLEILKRLKVGYRVEAQLLDAQWLGVPQARQRIIFVGVRDDLDMAPVFPAPLPYRYSVRDALPWLSGVECDIELSVDPEADISNFEIGRQAEKLGPGQQSSKFFSLVRAPIDGPSPAVTAVGGTSSIASVIHPTEKRKFYISELKRICAFPDDFELKGTYAQQWGRLGNSVPPVMMQHVAAALRDGVLLPARARTSGPARRSPGRSTTEKPPKGEGRPPRDAAQAETIEAPARTRSPRKPRERSPQAGSDVEAPTT